MSNETRNNSDAVDHANTGKGSGASGGGSLGNEQGEPKTGGSSHTTQRAPSDGKSPPDDDQTGE